MIAINNSENNVKTPVLNELSSNSMLCHGGNVNVYGVWGVTAALTGSAFQIRSLILTERTAAGVETIARAMASVRHLQYKYSMPAR